MWGLGKITIDSRTLLRTKGAGKTGEKEVYGTDQVRAARDRPKSTKERLNYKGGKLVSCGETK